MNNTFINNLTIYSQTGQFITCLSEIHQMIQGHLHSSVLGVALSQQLPLCS